MVLVFASMALGSPMTVDQSAGADRPHRCLDDLCPRLTGWGVQLAGGSHALSGLWHTGPGILLPAAEVLIASRRKIDCLDCI